MSEEKVDISDKIQRLFQRNLAAVAAFGITKKGVHEGPWTISRGLSENLNNWSRKFLLGYPLSKEFAQVGFVIDGTKPGAEAWTKRFTDLVNQVMTDEEVGLARIWIYENEGLKKNEISD